MKCEMLIPGNAPHPVLVKSSFLTEILMHNAGDPNAYFKQWLKVTSILQVF